jgi:hypothetical protein
MPTPVTAANMEKKRVPKILRSVAFMAGERGSLKTIVNPG